MFCDKQDLFEARLGGYRTYRIPGIVATPGGAVLVTTEARPLDGGDYDPIDVLMRRSTDGGITFAPPVKLVDHAAYGAGPANNFVMIADAPRDRVQAVFCHDYARVFTMHSDDDGESFSAPVEITDVFESFRADYPWRVCATGPGHGLRLSNGRLIVPVWLSDGSGNEMGRGRDGRPHRGHRPSAVTLVFSDDGGASWRRGDIVCRHGDVVDGETVVNPNETVAVELSDGRVMFNVRNESARHRRLVAVSPDGVSDWRMVGFDEALLEPVCMASMMRLADGRIAFINPDTVERTMSTARGPIGPPSCDRKRLTVKLSTDDGGTWPVSKVLEDGPAGYSDVAQAADGSLLCAYECGQVSGMWDDRWLRLARFDAAWVTDGACSAARLSATG